MNTYYFDNTTWVFHKEIVVLTENAYRKAMENNTNCALTHHWISFKANSLEHAKLTAKDIWDDIHVL